MSTKKLWLRVKAVDNQGIEQFISVYKKGRSIWIRDSGYKEHLCHPSVTSVDKVRTEILLVFHAKVVDVEMV